MAEDPIKLIIGGFVSIVILLVFLQVFSGITNMWGEDKCKPYMSEIKQKDTEISGLEKENFQLSDSLHQCRNEYDRLITENVTKKDIENIRQDFNITNTKIEVLEQKFETVKNSFVSVYNNLYIYFSVSIIINVFLVFLIIGDLISFAVFNFDIKKKLIEWLVSKIKRNKHDKVRS